MHTADASSNAERPRGPAFSYAPGSRPLDGYVIKRGLGQGGFGEVYFAVSDAGKEVALKVVRRNLDVELRGVTQCLNLKHPNLVGLYDVRVDAEGNHWIVMEYVAGRRLVDVLPEHPQGMPLEEALRWFRGIAAGTAYLHQSGIVHRDLKPANLFIENDVVKLGDYGLAKFISVSRRSGQTESVGTVHYMAPEIANGRYGKTIDIYALGVILYELTTGRVPFDGESVGEILMKHLTAEPDLSAVPAAVRPAVAAALSKDPELRPKTVDEFVAMVCGVAPQAQSAAAPRVPQPVRAGESDVRPLEPTLPHPGGASDEPPAWYRPSIVVMTLVTASVAWFLYRVQAVQSAPNVRILFMVGGMWVVALLGVTALKNREVAARRGRSGSPPALPAGGNGANSAPNWFWPIALGVTAACGLIGMLLLKSMRMYDGSAQPPFSWGIILMVVVWLATLSWLNRMRYRYGAGGRPPGTPGRHTGPIVWGPPAGGLSRVVLIVTGMVLLVGFVVFFSYATHHVEQATPAVAVVEPSHTIEIQSRVPPGPTSPGAGTGGPTASGGSARRVPADYLPTPTPQEHFTDQVTVFAPFWFILLVVIAGFALWVVRARLLLASRTSPSSAGNTTATPAPAVSRRASAAEFAASIVVTLVATVVVGRIALLLRGGSAEIESVLWLAVTAGVAASMLLTVERLFGSRPRDGWARRGPQALAAVPVGIASWWVSSFLMIEFDRHDDWPQMVGPNQWPECFTGGQPLFLAHIAYFALLFFAAAWWRQTERRRTARVQISEIVLAVLWAGVVNLFMPFPQPWGLLVAGTTATVVQFAAPWREAGLEKAIAMRLRGRA
jgi:predicted Ser/Thr protein kinase